MKKSFFLNLFFILSLFTLFSSCKKDTEESPKAQITITPEKESVNLGESIRINYTVSSPVDLKTITILINNRVAETITNFTAPKAHNGTYQFVGTTEDLDKSPIIQVEVIDIENERSLKSVSIRVSQSNAILPIVEYKNIILETQGINGAKQFLDADLGRTFTLGQAKQVASTIDFVVFYDATKKWVIAAPDDQLIRDYFTDQQNGVQSWSVRNRTKIKETSLTKREFSVIADGKEIRGEYARGGIPSNTNTQESFALQVNNLQEGYVFVFQTAEGKEGLVYISKIEGAAAGRITMSILIIK